MRRLERYDYYMGQRSCFVIRPEKVASNWGFVGLRAVQNRDIQGSPRRSLERYLLEGREGKYILEKISSTKRSKKDVESRILRVLRDNGLPVETYIETESGYIVKNEGFWIMKKYVSGKNIRRPDFINDSWRGRESALFLIKLKEISKNNGIRADAPDIPLFIRRLMLNMKRVMPATYKNVSDAYSALSSFLKGWENMPRAFTHGDFHPMNIIWGEERINAVIDWEFMGIRPELYDAAMMLGCIGIEDTDGLFSPYAEEFLRTMKKGNLTAKSWNMLPELILTTRFAWLDEWIRNKDDGMVKSEISYIQTLSENLEELRSYLL